MVAVCGFLLLAGGAAAELLSALFPEGVPGYDTGSGVTVRSRARPAYDPLGVPLGGFMLWPRLEQSVGYDDNVLAGGQRRGSAVIRTEPSVLLASRWSRDALGAFVSVGDIRYPGLPGQSRTDATLSVGGSIDIGDHRLTLAAAHVQRHQDRSELDALASDRPVAVRVTDARASYALNFGRWMLTPALEAASWRFGDTTALGAPNAQSWRDRTVLQGTTTLRYEWAPLRNLVLVGRAIGQKYAQPAPGQPRLDSTGYQFLAGFDYDDGSWRYRLLVGGASRQFATLQPHNDVVAEAEAAWSPTGMTTLRVILSRSIEDAAQEGVAGFTYTAGKFIIDHEYMRNVLLSAVAGLQRADFTQGAGRQIGYSAGAGVTWLMNRSMRLSLTHDLTGVSGSRTLPGALSGDHSRRLTLMRLRLGL